MKDNVENLIKINNRLKGILNNVDEGIIILEGAPLNGLGPRIIYVNESFQKLTGYGRNIILGSPVSTLIERDKINDLLYVFKNIDKYGNKCKIKILTKKIKKNKLSIKKPFVWTINEVANEKSKTLNFIVKLEPIKIKKPQDESNKIEKKNSYKSKYKNLEVIFKKSLKDLNLYLETISENMNMLNNQDFHAHSLESCLKNINSTTDKAKQLIKILGDYKFKTIKNYQIEDLKFAINEIGRAATFDTNIKFISKIENILWKSNCNLSQIKQALYYILNNSCKAIQKRGFVELEARNKTILANNPLNILSGDYIKITIRDSGYILNNQLINRLNSSYVYDIDSDDLNNIYYSKKVIKNHNGYFILESREGLGTLYQIYLPAIIDTKNISVKNKKSLNTKVDNPSNFVQSFEQKSINLTDLRTSIFEKG